MRSLILSIVIILTSTSSTLAGGHSPALKVEPLISTSSSVGGNDLIYPTGKAQVTAARFTLPVGGTAPKHIHPAPLVVIMMQGNITAEFEDGTMKTFMAGETFIEGANEAATVRNLGTEDAVGLVVFIGEEDMPVTVPVD